MSLDQVMSRGNGADSGSRPPPRPAQQARGRSPRNEGEAGESGLESFLRSPTASIPLPGRPPFKITTDRVRARPAISPQLSMMIGVTAIGLGTWGMLFPNSVKRTLGVKSSAPVVRLLFGLRESITGWTLAGDPTKAGMLWVRVVGDVFDIAALSGLDDPSNARRGMARAARAAVIGITALDLVTAIRMSTVKRTCEQGE